jgi:predicted RNase H-like HicB family nuclease
VNRTIILTKRSHDYHAEIKDIPACWGCGKTQDEAIGDLIRAHKSMFNLNIELKNEGE